MTAQYELDKDDTNKFAQIDKKKKDHMLQLYTKSHRQMRRAGSQEVVSPKKIPIVCLVPICQP